MKRISTPLEMLKKTLLLLICFATITLFNTKLYAQAKTYATETPTSGLVGYYNVILVGDVVNTNPGPDAGEVKTPDNAANSNESYATLIASYNNILGIAKGEGEAWIQLKFTNPVPAGKVSYIRFDEPTTKGLSLDLLKTVGGLTGLLKEQMVQLDVYSGAQGVAGVTKVVVDASGHTYFAVKSESEYNSIRVRLRYRGGLLGLALGASLNMNVYYGLHHGVENCAPAIYATQGESSGLNISLSELVKDPKNAIDNNLASYSQLQAGVVGLASSVSQTIFLNGLSNADDYAKVFLSVPPSLLTLDLFNEVKLQAYNGNQAIGLPVAISSLLNLDLLGLFSNNSIVPVYFKPGAPFDRVQISMGKVVAVGGNLLSGGLNIHEVQQTVAKPIFAGISGGVAGVCGNTVSLAVNNPNSGYTYNWYKKTDNTIVSLVKASVATFTESNVVPGEYTYYVSAQKSGCPGESDLEAVKITVTATPTVPTVSAPVVCIGSRAVLTVTNVKPGHTYKWYTVETGGTALSTGNSFTSTAPLALGTTYYVEAINGTCVSTTRVAVPVTVSPIPANATVAVSNVEITKGQTATLTASAAAGNAVKWYTVETGGTAVFTGPIYKTTALEATTIYYVEAQNAGGCVSAGREKVTVIVTDINPGSACNLPNAQGSGVEGICILCGVENGGAAIDLNANTFSSIRLTVGVVGQVYQRLYFPSVGAATDSIRLDVEIPGVLADVNVLGGVTINVMRNGAVVKSYPLNGGLLHLSLLSGERYKATLPAGAAFDAVEIRLGGVVTALTTVNVYGAEIIYPNPTIPVGGFNVCSGSTTALTATPIGTTTLKWFDLPTGGTELASGNTYSPTGLTAGKTYYIEVSNDAGCKNAERFPVKVNVNPAIVFAGSTLTNATVGAAYSKQITLATGGTPNFTYALATGSTLPAGLTLSTDGTIGGTPTAVPNDYSVTITATDGKGCSIDAVYNLKVTEGMNLPAMTLPNGIVNELYPTQVIPEATGGTTPYTYTASNLPPGLVFDETTREIKGTPTEKGTFTVPVTATDLNGNSVTRDYTIVVRDPLLLANTTLADGTVNIPYTTQTIPAATGGSGSYTYTATTGLPDGLTFNPATRQITGTPTKEGTFTFPVQVNDTEGNSKTTNYTIVVGSPLLLATKPLADGTVGVIYPTETIPAATGGDGNYTYEASNLPPGLTFDKLTREIKGNPTKSGSYNVSVKVTDGKGATVTQIYVVKVNGELNLPLATLPEGLVGTVYATYQLPAVTGGTSPYTYSLVGLPPALVFDDLTREIKGTPVTGGTFTLTMTATDNNGITTSTDYNLVVNVGAPVVAATTICSGSAATLSVSNALPGVTYNWYAATGNTSVFTGTTYTTGAINTSTTYYVQAVSGTALSSRTQVDVTTNPTPAVATVITANESISAGQSASLLVSATNGNTIKWFTTPTGGTSFFTGPAYTTPALSGTITYYVETENASGCVSATRAAVKVTVSTGAGNPNCNAAIKQVTGVDGLCLLCSIDGAGNSTDADLNNFTKINLVVGVGATGYQRLIFAGLGAATDSIRLDLATPVGLADVSVLGGITVKVMNGNTVVTSYTLDNALIDLKLLGGNRFKATLPAGGVYDRVEVRFGAVVSALSNLSIYGAEVIYPAPTVTTTGTLICSGSGTTLSATANGGTTLKWYDTATGGTALETGETFTVAGPLTSNKTYYIEVSKNGCANAQRIPVTVVVTTAPGVPTIAASAEVCAGSGAALAVNNPIAETTYRWYTTSTGGTAIFEGPVFTTPALNANISYYVEAAVGTCVSASRAAVAVKVNPLPVLPQVQVSSNTVNPGQTAILNATSTETDVIFNWYTAANQTTPIYTGPTYVTTPLMVTSTYYLEAVSTITGCAASSRVQITINVDGNGSSNPVPCERATTQIKGVDGIALLADVFNPELAIDDDTKTGSSLVLPVGLLGGSVYQRVGFSGLSTIGDTVRIKLTAPGKLLSVGVLSGITLTTYNGATSNNDVLSLNDALINLELLSGNTEALLSFVPTKTFDRVEVRLNAGVAGVLTTVDLNYAQRVMVAPTVTSALVTACATQTVTLSVANPNPLLTYRWYDHTGAYIAGKDGTSFVTEPLSTDTRYYVAASIAAVDCISYKTKIDVKVTAAPLTPELESPTVNTCANNDVVLRVKNPIAGITYQWFDGSNAHVADGTTLTVTVAGVDLTYTVKALDNTCGVSSIAAATATIIVGSLDAPIITPASVTVKVGVPAILTASSSTDGVIFTWYDVEVGGAPIATGSIFMAPAQTVPGTVTYYVEGAIVGGCTTNGRAKVTVTAIANNEADLVPCEAATTQTKGTTGIVVLTDVYNPELAVDKYASTASSLVIPVGILGGVYQRLGFDGPSNIGDTVRVMLSFPGKILSLSVLSSLEISTLNGGTSNGDITSINNALVNLELLSGDTQALLTFVPTKSFDAVEVKLNSGIVGAFTSVDINYAQRTMVAPKVTAKTVSACEGSSATLAINNPLPYVTYRWYQGSTFLKEGTTYNTLATLAEGSHDFFVTAARNGCESVKVKVVVTIMPVPELPVPDAGNLTSTCINTPVTLKVTPVAGVVYNWYDAAVGGNQLVANNASYTTPVNLVANTYEYFVEAVNSNSCANATRTKITLIVKTNAVATDIVVADEAICSGSAAVLTATAPGVAGAIFKWYTTPALTDTPFEGDKFTTPALTKTTKYYVTVSGTEVCANDALSAKVVTVTVNRKAIASDIDAAGKTICSGSAAILTASTTKVTNPVFSWYKNEDLSDVPKIGANFTTEILTATTKYYVTVSGSDACANDAASAKVVTVIVNRNADAADIDAGDKTTCEGTAVTLAASSTIDKPVFSWYRDKDLTDLAITGPSFTTPALTATTIYYVTVSGTSVCANGAGSAKMVTVTVNRNASASDIEIDDQTICAGTVAVIPAKSTTVSTPVFRWYRDASLTDFAFEGPTFTAPALTVTTKYYVTVSGTNACANDVNSAKVVTVTVTRNAGVTDIIADDHTICAGENVTLTANSPTVANGIFTWYRDSALSNKAHVGDSFSVIGLLTTTKFYVTVSGDGVCANVPGSAKVVTVTVNLMPIVPIIDPAGTEICAENATILKIKNPQTGVTYEWYTAESGGTKVNEGTSFTTGVLTASVDYFIEVRNASNCGNAGNRVKVTVKVASKPQVPSVVAGTVYTCINSPATLSISGGQAGVTYNWYATETSTTILGSGENFITDPITVATSTYYVEAKLGNCISAKRTPVIVNAGAIPLPPPSVSGAESPLCPGSTTVLTVNNPDPTLKYFWYTASTGGTGTEGTTFNVPPIAATTIYYVGSSNISTGCMSAERTAVTVTVLGKLDAPVVSVQSVTATSITFAWPAVTGATGYEVSVDNGITWIDPSSGAAGTTHVVSGLKPDEKAVISVRAKGQLACQLSDATTFTGTSDNPLGNNVFVPNTFTPNNDGQNDVFYVYGNTIAKMQLRVYSQWGQFLYESLNIQNGWDGTFKGQMQPNGVYVYYLELEFNDGSKATKKGTVTLLR